MGSVLSDLAIPLQGMYSASKHAVKAFTDALRMELEHNRIPVSVTLIKPSAINTPYTSRCATTCPSNRRIHRLYMCQLAAQAILRAAQVPTRDIVIGGGGRAITMAGVYAPRLIDKVMEWTMFRLQKTPRAKTATHDALMARPRICTPMAITAGTCGEPAPIWPHPNIES